MEKEEAKLKLVIILSNKYLDIRIDEAERRIVSINGSRLFSVGYFYQIETPHTKEYDVYLNDEFKAPYTFHRELRKTLSTLTKKDVWDIVRMKEDIGEV